MENRDLFDVLMPQRQVTIEHNGERVVILLRPLSIRETILVQRGLLSPLEAATGKSTEWLAGLSPQAVSQLADELGKLHEIEMGGIGGIREASGEAVTFEQMVGALWRYKTLQEILDLTVGQFALLARLALEWEERMWTRHLSEELLMVRCAVWGQQQDVQHFVRTLERVVYGKPADSKTGRSKAEELYASIKPGTPPPGYG